MWNAPRDDNRVPALLWVSALDWVTPVPIKVNPATWNVLIEISWGLPDEKVKADAWDPSAWYLSDKIDTTTGLLVDSINHKLYIMTNQPNWIAQLDWWWKIPTALLPAIAITDTFVVNSQAQMLALAAQKWDVAVRTDENKSYILAADDPTVLANWQVLLTPTDSVLSVFGRTWIITAQTWDYTTDQVSETALRVFLSPTEKVSLISNESTWLRNWCSMSINADTTKFDIAAWTLYFVDSTSAPNAPAITKVDYAWSSANTVTNIASQNATFIGIDVGWNIIQQASAFTQTQRRTIVQLWALIHSNRVNINVINNIPVVSINSTDQMYDLMMWIKQFNVSWNVISYNWANLNINKSSWSMFKSWSNFTNDPKNPHVVTNSILSAPSNIRYRTQNW